mmetsp:Transcript_13608/g.15119  ORF Transcript_13608/g.15119 Transcript_13608/m.15119 type:complete len:448 (+) Transcript_13608:22-1365(+)
MISRLPLRNLRVLDFSRILAGPWCTMLLGDAGANIIKVERMGTGDDTRSWGPPFLHGKEENNMSHHRLSTYFLSVNRNKRSLAVNLKTDEGRDICHRLATEWADVVIENFKVNTMERYGLDYTTLQHDNPGLVYCSITGFGRTGPLRNQPGYDVIASGMYGLMSITGEENGNPVKAGVAITDIVTGSLAHGGILAALHERNQTGLGQRVDLSLMETQLASLVNIGSSVLNNPTTTKDEEDSSPPTPKRWGTAHESIVPYQSFQCKPSNTKLDDPQYIVIGAGNDDQFVKLCQILDAPDWAIDSRFRTNSDRVANRKLLVKLLSQRFLQKSRDEWVSLLEGRGFPMGPVRTVPEAFQCEQAINRNMILQLDHPVIGPIRLPGTPIKYSSSINSNIPNNGNGIDDSSTTASPPPMLGEHTKEILRSELKFTDKDIYGFQQNGIIECWKQ